ncbi:PDR/VanB family oxidoreductase [Quadrisphaera sp. KR29]|uniref:PDR/VanB family oxidoreductase n=1 Tax=Quadrisphaera sp. KR29 TaxID=3461391 RepID=UPI004044CA2F
MSAPAPAGAASTALRPARVVEARDVADGVRRVVLEHAPGRPAEPGAHLQLAVHVDAPGSPGGPRREVRSYSVVDASADGTRSAISVLLTPTSRGGGRYVHSLAVGDDVECSAPVQGFPLRLGAGRYHLLAGGIGITALLAMARRLAARGADVVLDHVVRTRSRAAYADELAAVLGERYRLHVDDERGAFDVAALLDAVAGDHDTVPGGVEAYVCGPIRLMDAVRRGWEARGLPASTLRFETFGSSGWYAPQPFEVAVPEIGLRTTVGPGTTLLEALQRAGADLMYDCRKGECGLCRLEVASVRGTIDHRDVFLSRRQQEAGTAVCVCVSRVAAAPGADGHDAGAPPELVLRLP